MLNKSGIDGDERKRIIAVAKMAIKYFNSGDWETIGVHTGQLDVITGHDRLLRSLRFDDPDYPGCANGVMFELVKLDPANLDIIAQYIAENYGEEGENVSTSGGKGRAMVIPPESKGRHR